MSEENVTRMVQMISTAGMARAKYMEAVRAAKAQNFEKVPELMEIGDECFGKAHELHSEFLASGSADFTACGVGAEINLILVHAEDQMMCAETFRMMAAELVDVYRKLYDKKKN